MKTLHLISILLLGLTINLFSQTVPTNGLVAWYPFNGNANDQSGNNLNGVVNGASLTTDRFGTPNSAYEFDGINDFIEVIHSNLLNFNVNDDFTITLWVNALNQLGSGNTVDIIGKWEDNPGGSNLSYPFAIRMRRTAPIGTLQMLRLDQNCSNFPILLSNASIIDSNWHNLIYQKDGNLLKMYIDGLQVNQTNDITTCSTLNLLSMFIGKRGGSLNPAHFRGKIDDIAIYNRALSPCEINMLFSLNLNVGLVAHYPLDGNALDISGNNHNGTVLGVTFASDRFNNPNSVANFDGIDDYIDMGNIIDLSSQNALSISAWFYPEIINGTINRYAGISFGDKPTGELALRVTQESLQSLQAILADGNNQSQLGNNTSANSLNFNYNQWYHLVGLYEDQNMKIYVNGQLVGTNSGSNGIGGTFAALPSNLTLLLGKAYNTNFDERFFHGRLDDIRIYNRVINDCEILALYDLELVSLNPDCCFMPNDSITDPAEPNPLEPDPLFNLTIPNVITPNGDDYNDCFEILNLSKFRSNRLEIYNRYGRKVFSQNFYSQNWCAQNLPSGTYFYYLKLNDGQINYKGFVEVIK